MMKECQTNASIHSTTVFSAPKYCDQTPNKGAYINIKSDYKLDFHTFDAAPHPPIQPMVRSGFYP